MKTEKQILKRLKIYEDNLTAKRADPNKKVDENGLFATEWLFITEINALNWVLGIKKIKLKTVICHRYKRVRFVASKEFLVIKSDHPEFSKGTYMTNEQVRQAILDTYSLSNLNLEPTEIHEIRINEVAVKPVETTPT
jgi:hypothetical protein